MITSTDQSGTEGSGSTMNRAGADDNDFVWGWLGLLGLIGLAGLMRRDPARDGYRETGVGAIPDRKSFTGFDMPCAV